MSAFTDVLWLTPNTADGKRRWQIVRDCPWELGAKGSGWLIIIKAGFITDLATIPRFMWWLFDADDPRYAAAATLHDYLIQQGIFDRETVDAQFLAALRANGVRFLESRLLYWAVCSFRFWRHEVF